MPSPKISSLGEKKLIERIIEAAKSSFEGYDLTGLGDDAALIEAGQEYIVLTSDLLRQKTHFPGLMEPYDMGWKTVTVNMSDIAAMGSKPVAFVLSMAIPDMELEVFDALIEGVMDACRRYRAPLIGGDTNEADEIILAGTAVGRVDKEKVLLKSGASEGDLIAVTGPLGLSAAGTEILLHADEKRIEFPSAVKKSLRPDARVEEALLISESKLASAATDITDGLVSELGEIMRASKKGMRIFRDKIPVPEEVFGVADALGVEPFDLALYYGEDFEILLTAPPENMEKLCNLIKLYVIGEVTGSGIIEMVDKDGITYEIEVKGYEHLSAR